MEGGERDEGKLQRREDEPQYQVPKSVQQAAPALPKIEITIYASGCWEKKPYEPFILGD